MQILTPTQNAFHTQTLAFEPPMTSELTARALMPRRGLLDMSDGCRLSTIGPPKTINVAIEGRCRLTTDADPVKIKLQCEQGPLKSESTTNPGSNVKSRFLFLSGVTGTQVTVTGGKDSLECTQSNGDIREYDLENGTSQVRQGPVAPVEGSDTKEPGQPTAPEPLQRNTKPRPLGNMRNSAGAATSLSAVLLGCVVLSAAALS